MLFLILFACKSTPESHPAPELAVTAVPEQGGSTRTVDIQTFAADRDAGIVAVVIDVRTQKEWDAGHVPGAVHIPMDEVDARMAELDAYRGDEVYLICQSGGRSGRVAKALSADGFATVNVDGGTGGWIAAGHPVE